jgi:GGDEF domain-containing protein
MRREEVADGSWLSAATPYESLGVSNAIGTHRDPQDLFSVLVRELHRVVRGVEAANSVAQRILESSANDGLGQVLSVSVGVAVYPHDGERIETLLNAAGYVRDEGRKKIVSTNNSVGRPLTK